MPAIPKFKVGDSFLAVLPQALFPGVTEVTVKANSTNAVCVQLTLPSCAETSCPDVWFKVAEISKLDTCCQEPA